MVNEVALISKVFHLRTDQYGNNFTLTSHHMLLNLSPLAMRWMAQRKYVPSDMESW